MTPSAVLPAAKRRALSPSSLNRLQAKVLRAKLTNDPNAEALEKEYDAEVRRVNGQESDSNDGVQTQIELLPTLDARGRLYDVGEGKDDGSPLPGNRKRKQKVAVSAPLASG